MKLKVRLEFKFNHELTNYRESFNKYLFCFVGIFRIPWESKSFRTWKLIQEIPSHWTTLDKDGRACSPHQHRQINQTTALLCLLGELCLRSSYQGFFPSFITLFTRNFDAYSTCIDCIACSWVNKCHFWCILFSTQVCLSWKLKRFEQCISIKQYEMTIVCCHRART